MIAEKTRINTSCAYANIPLPVTSAASAVSNAACRDDESDLALTHRERFVLALSLIRASMF
jgi:hypothetical protein